MKAFKIIMAIAMLGLVGCKSMDSSGSDEKSVPLSEVPAPALGAAQAAVEGIVLEEAEVETEKGQLVYSIEGEANGKEYEIEVTADGKVLEVEEEHEHEDGDEHEK